MDLSTFQWPALLFGLMLLICCHPTHGGGGHADDIPGDETLDEASAEETVEYDFGDGFDDADVAPGSTHSLRTGLAAVGGSSASPGHRISFRVTTVISVARADSDEHVLETGASAAVRLGNEGRNR